MFIQSPVDECLSGFQGLAIVSSTAGNIPVEGFEYRVSSVFKYLPRDGITGSYGDSLRNGKLFTIVDAPAVYEHYNCSTSSRTFFSFYFLFKKKILAILLLLLSRFSRVRLCATPETAAHQAPSSLGFSRQEHWSGLPFPSPVHESEK